MIGFIRGEKISLLLKLLVVALLISSCSSNVTTVKDDIDVLSDSGYGYLLLGLDTERTLHEISIDGSKNVFLSSNDLRPGENYLLIELPLGKYNIRKIHLDNYRYFKLDKEKWSFEVKENTISYAGDLAIRVIEFSRRSRNGISRSVNADIVLENNSSFALEFLESTYKQILENREVVYSGPGEDSFLSYTQTSN